MKIVGQKNGVILIRLNRSKYEPHHSTRERARRLKQMIHGTLRRANGAPSVPEEFLISEYLKCKS